MSGVAMRIGTSESRIAPAPTASTESPASTGGLPSEPGGETSPFAHVLRGIGQELVRGEATLRHAVAAPRDLGPAELIALQAGVYRYSEAIDLASHLVDRATNGVKTVIQGGGQ
jgi:hypothetical protein